MGKLLRNFFRKFKLRNRLSKAERLIYIVIVLWIAFGALGIVEGVNLTQLAGYYASLTLFVSTYLWGEYKRASKTTPIYMKGENSSREVIIYVTVLLWTIAGVCGVFLMEDINPLTVYFSALSPFVMSYIIYKTSKGSGDMSDLPIFDGKSQELIDNAKGAADVTKPKEVKPVEEPVVDPSTVNTDEPKDNQTTPADAGTIDDSKDVTTGI